MKNIRKFNEFLTESNSGREVTFTNGDESIIVNVIDDISGYDFLSRDDRSNPISYQVTFEEVKRVLKQNKFNDDKFGQFMASYEGPEDEDPNWIYVEDTQDDEEYEMFDDYNYYYLVPGGGTRTING